MDRLRLEPEDDEIGNELILLQACAKFKGLIHRLNNYDMALLIYNMQICWHSQNSMVKTLPCGTLKLCFRHAIGECEKSSTKCSDRGLHKIYQV